MHKKTVIDFKELGARQIFTDAIKELKTKDIKEVKHLLTEVEAYQNKGYYAVGYVSYEAAPAFETKISGYCWSINVRVSPLLHYS